MLKADIEVYRQANQARFQQAWDSREAHRQQALETVERIAPPIMAHYCGVTVAYLFGSILQPGSFRPDSDIDIAIEGGTAEDYFALWHELEDALPEWFIDLRDLPADEFFTQKVLLLGKKIYDCSNERVTNRNS